MKHYKKSIILSCVVALILYSCEKELITDIIVNPKLCFNCILNPDSLIHGSLSLSQSISENKVFKKINKAIIEIKRDGQVIGIMQNTGDGVYSLNIKSNSGSLYEVSIVIEGFKPLSAATRIPQKPKVTFVKGPPKIDPENGTNSEPLYDVTYTIYDKPGVNRYWNYSKSKFNGTWHFYGGYGGIDSPFFDNFNKDIDATYEYGFFYQYYLRINDFGFEGSSFSFTDKYYSTHIIESFFLDADEHYDKYLKSTIKQRMNDGDNLLFNEPVQIYSNIENGLGIFGSTAITSFKL